METIKRERRKDSITAQAKCEAVLSIWTQRRKPAAICQELNVQWAIINHWQDRALKAMLAALEPRQMEEGNAQRLPTRLQKLFNRHVDGHQPPPILPKITARLDKIQQEKTAKKKPDEQ